MTSSKWIPVRLTKLGAKEVQGGIGRKKPISSDVSYSGSFPNFPISKKSTLIDLLAMKNILEDIRSRSNPSGFSYLRIDILRNHLINTISEIEKGSHEQLNSSNTKTKKTNQKNKTTNPTIKKKTKNRQ